MSSDIAAGVIHRLKEVMAELEADKKRMDWLQANPGAWAAIQHYVRVKSEPNVQIGRAHV